MNAASQKELLEAAKHVVRNGYEAEIFDGYVVVQDPVQQVQGKMIGVAHHEPMRIKSYAEAVRFVDARS